MYRKTTMDFNHILSTKIIDIFAIFLFIVLFSRLTQIKINNPRAAIAVSTIAIIEILFSALLFRSERGHLYALISVLLMNPFIEEAVRVKFSQKYDPNILSEFLEVSLMIGCVEAIVKTFSLTIRFEPASYFSELNTYIVLCGVGSILLHLNFGFILSKIQNINIYVTTIIMAILHSIYNFLFIFTEPQQLINKNIHLMIFVIINLALLSKSIRNSMTNR